MQIVVNKAFIGINFVSYKPFSKGKYLKKKVKTLFITLL